MKCGGFAKAGFLAAVLSAWGALLMAPGCSPRGLEQQAGGERLANKRLRFVFIAPTMNEEFFRPVKKGMRDAAAMLDVECEFTGTVDVNLEKQAQLVLDAMARGCDGIALDIIDPTAFDRVAQAAADRGVPLVAFNVDDHATPNLRLSAVCQNLYEAGRRMGRRLADRIPDKSRIVVTMHSSGISALEDRRRGIQEALAAKHPSWKVVITGAEPGPAADAIAKALAEDPSIRAVLCTGQADTEGAGLAVERLGKDKGCLVAGFDLSPEILRLIQAGIVESSIDQQPYAQGFYPVVQLALRCRYGILPSNMDTGAAFVTRENAAAVSELCGKEYR